MSKLKIRSRSGLRVFDMATLRSWKPCYDPSRYLPEDFRGTAVDILNNEAIPFHDRLWVVCRSGIISDRVMRLFVVWCARQMQHLMTDKRSIEALDVAERFANGQATKAELSAAQDAAWAAAADATADTVRAAAWAGATTAVRVPAWADAACAAAWAGATTAVRVPAWADAADATADTVRAPIPAARDAQRDKLIEMVEAEGRERVAGRKKGGKG